MLTKKSKKQENLGKLCREAIKVSDNLSGGSTNDEEIKEAQRSIDALITELVNAEILIKSQVRMLQRSEPTGNRMVDRIAHYGVIRRGTEWLKRWKRKRK